MIKSTKSFKIYLTLAFALALIALGVFLSNSPSAKAQSGTCTMCEWSQNSPGHPEMGVSEVCWCGEYDEDTQYLCTDLF